MTSAHIRLEQAKPRGGQDCAAQCCECLEQGADIGCLLSAWNGGEHGLGTLYVRSTKAVVETSLCHLFKHMGWIALLVEKTK